MAAFWNRLFDIQSLEHGQNYFLRGQVQNLRQEGMRFTAEVQGTATYQVELEWEPDCVVSMTCGCPYAQRGNRCKHMAAVLFAISSSHADWEEALERLPAEALRRLLHDLAARDEHLRERLVRTANGPGDTRELWMLDLQRMMNRYVPYGDWFDYHDAEQLMTDFSVYLEDNTEYLLRAGRLLDASHLTELVYGTAMEVQMDDSAGGLTMLMEDCHRNLNTFLLYEESLRRWSPQRTMELFICLLKQEMDRNCERKMYRHTIAHLPASTNTPTAPTPPSPSPDTGSSTTKTAPP